MFSISLFLPVFPITLFLQEPHSESNHFFKIPLGPSSKTTTWEYGLPHPCGNCLTFYLADPHPSGFSLTMWEMHVTTLFFVSAWR